MIYHMNIPNIYFFLFQQLAGQQPLLQQPLLQLPLQAVTHLIILTLLLQEQLQQMVREKSENIMNISEMK